MALRLAGHQSPAGVGGASEAPSWPPRCFRTSLALPRKSSTLRNVQIKDGLIAVSQLWAKGHARPLFPGRQFGYIGSHLRTAVPGGCDSRTAGGRPPSRGLACQT